MVTNFRVVLSPLLFISYVFGARIVKFPAGKPRPWYSFLYILLVWSIYNVLLWYTILPEINEYKFLMHFCLWLNISIALLTVVLGIYYDKKYTTCLEKLAIVDDTLEKIGMITDYQKLYMRVLFTVFGWFAYVVYTIYTGVVWYRDIYSAIYAFVMVCMYGYTTYVNLLDDLVIISTLGYIELKFEQINQYVRTLERNNEHEIMRAWKHSVLLRCQNGYSNFMSSECATWVVIHLHLELCKISRQLNSMFGLQMAVKMGTYFALITLSYKQFFDLIFTANYMQKKPFLIIFMHIFFLAFNTFRLFIINYICEKVSVKANATGDVINTIPYSIYDVVVRENISQFLSQMRLTPLKFYGLGLFKFGLKFFYEFSSSVTTVIVIILQSHIET